MKTEITDEEIDERLVELGIDLDKMDKEYALLSQSVETKE